MAASVDLLGRSESLAIDSLPLYSQALQSLNPAELSDSGHDTTSSVAHGASGNAELELPTDSLFAFPSNFPAVKRIPNTRFIVDGFRNAGPWSVTYFLSHFHSDHYTGLTNLWKKGLVFCSEVTAHLVKASLQVPEVLVIPLPMGKPVVIDGCEVSLVDANHCPGAVQFLFRVPGEGGGHELRYVHCGDMRYAPFMKSDASLCDYVGADAVFLDTTYCNPKFVFPSQQESVEYVAETVERLMGTDSSEIPASRDEDDTAMVEVGDHSDEEVEDLECDEKIAQRSREELILGGEECGSRFSNVGILDMEEGGGSPRKSRVENGEGEELLDGSNSEQHPAANKGDTLFLISTYVIGKEKILTAVARRCGCLIYVTEKKFSLLKCLGLKDFGVFTTNPEATNVHVVQWSFLGETWPYFRPNFVNMERAMREKGYRRVVGFVPTGWTYELKKKTFSVRKKGPFEIHLVPYSEHSNYDELREYVGFLRPKEIIPTVGLDGGGMDSKVVATMRKHFRNLVDETASKRNFLKGFSRKPPEEVALCSHLLGCEGSVTPKLEGSHLQKDDVDPAFPMQSLQDEKPLCINGATPGPDNVAFDPDAHSFMALSESNGKQQAVVAPKAVFGRAARKRRRDSDEGDLGDNLGTMPSDLIATPMAPEIQENLRTIKASIEPDVPVLGSSSQDFFDRTSGLHEKQLDLGNKEAVKEISNSTLTTRQNGAMGYGSNVDLRSGNAVNSQINFSQPVSKSSSQRSPAVSNKTTNRSQARIPARQKPSASKKVKKTKVSSLQSKKPIQPPRDAAASFPSRSPKAKQSSILNFFKKPAEDGSSTQSHIVLSKEELLMIAGDSSTLKSDDSTTLLTIQIEERMNSIPVQMNLNKWADEYEQLASILDGNLSKELAHRLLEKANGDVGVALDFFYSGEIVDGGSGPPVHDCDVSLNTRDQMMVGDTSEGSVFPVAKDQVAEVEEVVEKTIRPPETMTMGDPVPIVGGADSILRLPGHEKLEESKMRDATEKLTISVGVPVGKYSPREHACWKSGDPAPYLHLARAFDLVEQESSRLRTADMLCNMFRSLLALSPDDVLPAVYLTTNRIAPDFEGVDLNIGGSIVSTAVGEVAGVSRAKLREMYTSMGDLGDVAQACRQTQSILRLPSPLSICQVFSTLKQISKESGGGSGARKKELILSLLRACREKEMKYIVRTLVQNMRIGAMMKTVLSALAQAVVLHHSFPTDQPPIKALEKLKPKFQEAALAVVEAYNFLPNLDVLVPALIKDGVTELSANFSILPGTPIKPMLAKITNGISELLKRFHKQAFTCEYKYDGQRAQIHMLADGSVRIFSRNCEDTTGRFPDVKDIVRLAAREDLKSFIIDAEVVAVDRDKANKLMAFQHLSTRERGSRDGSSVNLQNIKVDVCVFVFDMMYANQESLVKMSFRERRKCMHHWFPNTKPGLFGYASEITIEAEEDPSDPVLISQRVEGFLDEAFTASCEGLMAKALDEDSNYMASKRSDSWLKIKRDYMEGLNDSLDLVPIGAWYGNGRKAGWYSPFLLACYDSEREEYQSVCRVMSGFTDVFYKEMKEFYSGDRILPRQPPYYRTGEECDIWFSPELVWEIRGADFTVSPVHQAAVGLVHPSRGISMRFPRHIRSRPDKKPENASTPADIADLFHQQTRKLDVPGSASKVSDRSDSKN